VTFLFSLFDFLEANDKATLYRKIEDELLEHNLSIAATDIFEEVKGEYASTLEDKRNGNAQ
jgi:hypothetical protein